MPTRLGRYCEAVIETGWLGAIILVPLFFNVYSARVFEPDKLTLLRSIVLVMTAAWAVKVVDGKEWKNLPPARSWWRFPLVAPVAALALVYLITTLFSITPRVSLLGSYQRLQGTYTTLSYLVVFVMMLLHLRSKAQVNRVVTTAIVVSIPISLYGLLQKYGLDPLPWGGDVTRRIASNMGNSIFVSAYIIMVTPLAIGRIVQSFSSILTDEELSWADVVRASIYIFVVALHMLAILFSQSRGPLLGFLAGQFTLVLILLVYLRDHASGPGRLKLKELALAVGSLVAADLIGAGLFYLLGLLATGQGWIAIESTRLAADAYRAALLGGISFLGALVGGIVILFLFTAARRGWRWLWLGFILQAGLVAGFLILFNLPDSPISDWRQLPYIGRIGTALDLQANTAKVRTYIWDGVVEMLAPHEPLAFPDGRQDPFHVIRPLVGYGPESMYVTYNRFYQPELAHVEKRNASPDRSHNETFDALAITGILGFLAWQALYGSLFYLGFRWLGVIRSKTDTIIFVGSVLGIGILSAVVFWQWLGLSYIGVAFPFGELAGLLAYLAYYALFSKPAEQPTSNPNFVLLTALLAAAAGHFAEIHFGIAIAATRTYFFAYAALAVLVGYVLPKATGSSEHGGQDRSSPAEQSTRGKRKRSQMRRHASARTVVSPNRDWVKPVLLGGLIMGLMLGTLGYEFISNPQRPDPNDLPTTGQIFWDSLTKNPKEDWATTYAGLGLFALTALVGGALVVSEAIKDGELSGERAATLKGIATYLGTAGAIGTMYMFFQAGRLRFLSTGAGAREEHTTLERIRIAADGTAGVLTAFYLFVFLMLLAMAFVLVRGRSVSTKPASGTSWTVLLVSAVAAIILINTTNLDVIQADIIYKQADPWDRRAMQEKNPVLWGLAIAEYDHALELAPSEDYYYLFLGRAYLEQSTVMNDLVAQQQLMEEARDKLLRAGEINPLNTDHSANLARLHTRWAELASSDVERSTKANQAFEYYEQANSLSPNNAVILNEWAMLMVGLFGDCEGGLEKLDQSLAIDAKYEATYQNIGNVALTCGDRESDGDRRQALYQQAQQAYTQQLALDKCDLQALTALGYAESKLGSLENAIQANLDGLACVASPTSPSTLQFHRNLAILYGEQGDLESAVIHAQSAAQAAGDNINSLVDAGRILLQLGALEQAHWVALQIGSLAPQSWNQLRDLAILFAQAGYPAEGLPYAQQAWQLAPDAEKPGVEELINSLQVQPATP